MASNDKAASKRESNLRCPSCGHTMWAGPIKSPIEVSVLWFCPGCRTAMDRLDPLGAIEAEQRGDGPETFEEYVKRPEVLGVMEVDLDE